MTRPLIVFVVAAAENGVIGKDGGMPWRLPDDLKHFRAVTMNKPVIMGRRTFESIGKPLDGRDNIVISRSMRPREGVLVARSAEEAVRMGVEKAAARGAEEIAVIGGGEVYEALLPVADRICLTRVHARPEGDTFFADPDPRVWREISRKTVPAGERNSFDFSIMVLKKLPEKA
ncbi:MAG: dihydrofolate reductase [Hyphomicrobiales bacterium]